MPDVEKLFDMIQSNPPDSVEELGDMLADTGYAEPTGVAGLEGEELIGEEMEEEGMEEEGMEEEGAPSSLDDLLTGIEGEPEGMAEEEVEEEEIGPAPAGMEGGAEGVSISVMRGNAAKNAFEKHKKKGKDEESE